jgi:hypothetical protein
MNAPIWESTKGVKSQIWNSFFHKIHDLELKYIYINIHTQGFCYSTQKTADVFTRVATWV